MSPDSVGARAVAALRFTRDHTGAIAAAAVVAVVVVVVAVRALVPGAPPPPESRIPVASRAAAGASTTTIGPSGIVVVYVAGAVSDPGVYRLNDGQRVIDAIDAAGGPRADADLARVNLAAKVTDGERVYVPAAGEVAVPAVDGDRDAAGSAPLNVNQATADQLDALPGVGPATAAAIVAYRRDHGPFQSVDQLGNVHGIGPSKLEQLRPLVTV